MKSSDDDKSSAAPAATEPMSTEVPSGESAVSSPPIHSGQERKKATSGTSVDAERLAHFDVAIENAKKCDNITDNNGKPRGLNNAVSISVILMILAALIGSMASFANR